jgi:putative transposase
MKLKSGEIYHIYNRGNNRQRLFYERENYYYFLAKARQYLAPNCDFLAYCLMPNHFHFLIHANHKTTSPYGRRIKKGLKQSLILQEPLTTGLKMNRFSKGLQLLLSSYAKGINKKYSRSGSLFRQNTKSKQTSSELFSEDYTLPCFIYIHNNPVTAGLVHYPDEWEFSSMREYKGLCGNNPLCNLELAKQLLSLDRNEIAYLNNVEMPTEVIRKIFK